MSNPVQGESYPSTAFALSLAAGILMIISGLVSVLWPSARWPFMTHMMGFGWPWMGGLVALGLLAGVIVLVSALLLRGRPQESSTWGALILAFSVVSLFGMGGFLVGAALGLVGGALALTWKG